MSYKRRRGLGGRGTGEDGGRGAAPRGTGTPPRGTGTPPRGTGRPQRPAPPGGLRAFISASAIAGALLLGYAVAALWLFPSEASAGDASVIEVPDVVGLSEADARTRIVDAGLVFTVASGMAHPDAAEGSVLAQNPLPGQVARPGAPVEVVLSRGPEVHTLPDVAGLSERQARIVLERLGYEVEVESRENPLPAGEAIETRPPAGTRLEVPDRLVLVVSEGAPIVAVPDMLGMHIDDAVDILADARLELGSISFDPGAMEAPGRIVGQYPPAGYSLRAGDVVELRVAGDRESLERAGTGEARDAGGDEDGDGAPAGEAGEEPAGEQPAGEEPAGEEPGLL